MADSMNGSHCAAPREASTGMGLPDSALRAAHVLPATTEARTQAEVRRCSSF
jgi:hypothetical protein